MSSRSTRRNAASASTACTRRPTSARRSARPRVRADAGRHSAASRSMASRSSTTWAARPSPITPFCPRSRLAKINPDAPFDKVCYIGCGVTTGIGAVINTAKVEPGCRAVVFGLGGIGLNVIQGCGGRRGADRRRRSQPDKKEWGERFGMTDFVNPPRSRAISCPTWWT
jgi:hypothetical protein